MHNWSLIAPFWPEIYLTDSERKQDLGEAERTSLFMEQVCHDCGYELLKLPKAPADQRAKFILQNLPSF